MKFVQKEFSCSIEEKKSKFIGYIKPVTSAREAEEYINYIDEDYKEIEDIEQIMELAEKIERDTDRDFYMSAEEAKSYGVVDKIISKSQ